MAAGSEGNGCGRGAPQRSHATARHYLPSDSMGAMDLEHLLRKFPTGNACCGIHGIVFADELNAFRKFPLTTPNNVAIETDEACQRKLHKWGSADQVQLDPKKESLHITPHYCPIGNNFKIIY